MKGREVREVLQNDFPPALVHVIAEIAEDNSTISQELSALAMLLDNITDVLGGVTEVMAEVKATSERIRNG